MNSKKWIIQYLEVLLDIIVMFTSYLIANWYKFGFFRTGLINHTEHYLTLFLVELVAYVVVHFVAFADDNLINRKLFPEIYNVLKPQLEAGKNVLVVGHGAMNCSIVNQFRGTPIKDFWKDMQGNCELLRVE